MAVSTTTALLLAGGAAAAGSVLSSQAQQRAAEQATQAQIAAQKETLERQLELQRPFREAGQQALGLITQELQQPIQETPGFRFRQEQSQKQLDRLLAARGLLGSGEGIRQSLGLTQQLTEQELGRRDRLMGSALGLGSQALGLGSRAVGLSGYQTGEALSQQALLRGQAQSGLFQNLSSLGVGAAGLYSGLNPSTTTGTGAL